MADEDPENASRQLYSGISATSSIQPDDELSPLLTGPLHGNYDVARNISGRMDVVIYSRRWYILFVFSMLAFAQGAVWNTWGAIAATAEPAMGWKDSDIALLTNWGTITFILSAFFFAWLMDVKGLRWAGILTSILTLFGTLLRCITVHQPTATWLIHIGQMLNGFAGPVVMAMPPLISVTWFPVHERTISTAIACCFNGLGVAMSFIIGPLVVPDLSNNTVPSNHSSFLLRSSGLRSSGYSPNDIVTMQHDIMKLMYIECGFAAAVALAFIVYFPPKPPTPPSITASITRVDFKSGILDILRHKDFWMLGGAYAISTGVNNCWAAVLDVNLKPIGINQDTSGYIAFTGTVAGNVSGVIISIFASIFARKMKVFLVVLYTVGTVAFLVFTLECAGYIPYHIGILYFTMVIGSISLISAVPLLYELICEATYPVAEGLTNTAVTLLNNFAGLIFLFVLMIPIQDKSWMNWTIVACTAVCVPIFMLYREHYNRLDIDTQKSEDQ